MAASASGSAADEHQMVSEAIHFTTGRICEEVGSQLGVTFTRQVMATIADITSSQLDTYAGDLAAFARHAKRTVVSPDDVKLLVRRNPKLKEHIDGKAVEWETEASGGKEKKKRGPKKRKASAPASSPRRSDDEEDHGVGAEGPADDDEIETID